MLLAAALFLLLSVAYAFSIGIRASQGASITGDEPLYLLTTQSLLADGDLDLSNQYAGKSYKAFFDHPDDLWLQSEPLPDGRPLSPHNPGLSVLVMPGFALGGLVGAQVQLMLLAAATMSLAFVLADRLNGRRAISWAVALGVGLTATAFIYFTEIYPEFPAALALVAAMLLVARQRRLGLVDGLWLVAALSAMCWLGTKYAPLVLAVSGYFLLKADGRGRIALLVAGGISAIVFAWFHLHVYGSLTPYGAGVVYAQWNTIEILGQHIEFAERYYRLCGIFIDRQFGIGRWAPLPLAVVPMGLLIARTPPWGKIAVALLGAYTLAITVGLALAAHAQEIAIAVDPFDMSYPPFQGLAGLFPWYSWWTAETWWLTWFWLTLAGLVTGAMVWTDIVGGTRRLGRTVGHWRNRSATCA